MEVSVGEFIGALILAVVSSTGIASVISGAFSASQDKRARKREVEDRRHAEERERLERYRRLREASRDAHLTEIVDVVGFLQSKQAEHAEKNEGLWVFHQPDAPDAVPDWTTAIVVLRRMALIHHDPEIRTRCKQTVDSIEGAWVEMVEEPNISEIGTWIEWLRESAELMHTGALD